MFLVIDNYDSFVHNLARYFELTGEECRVVRNDAITVEEIEAMAPQALVLSPGPCTPKEAGICVEAVQKLGANLPILGVCLGHQAIGEAYGALVLRGKTPTHGKATPIKHNSQALFAGLPSPMQVGRYHSLIIEPPAKCPLITTAQTDEDEIMAIQHQTHPVYGAQFHPESVLTDHGLTLVQNFVNIAHNWHQTQRHAA